MMIEETSFETDLQDLSDLYADLEHEISKEIEIMNEDESDFGEKLENIEASLCELIDTMSPSQQITAEKPENESQLDDCPSDTIRNYFISFAQSLAESELEEDVIDIQTLDSNDIFVENVDLQDLRNVEVNNINDEILLPDESSNILNYLEDNIITNIEEFKSLKNSQNTAAIEDFIVPLNNTENNKDDEKDMNTNENIPRNHKNDRKKGHPLTLLESDDLTVISAADGTMEAIDHKVDLDNNVQIEYLSEDTDGNLHTINQKIVLENGIQIEILNPFQYAENISKNPDSIFNPDYVRDTDSLSIERLTDKDTKTILNKDLNFCKKRPIKRAVKRKRRKPTNKKKSRPRAKRSVRAKRKVKDTCIITDSMLDLITSNNNEDTMQNENMKQFVKSLEESIEKKIQATSIRQELEVEPKLQDLSKKPYVCYICKEQFELRPKLAEHMRRHDNVKKYDCEFCDKKFVVLYDLYRHNKKVHKANGNNGNMKETKGPLSMKYPYTCDLCQMVFETKSDMVEHEHETHANEITKLEANEPVECEHAQDKTTHKISCELVLEYYKPDPANKIIITDDPNQTNLIELV